MNVYPENTNAPEVVGLIAFAALILYFIWDTKRAKASDAE